MTVVSGVKYLLEIMGIVFFALGFVVNRIGKNRKYERTIVTKGHVTGLQKRLMDAQMESYTYALEVEFTDDQGKVIKGVTDVAKGYGMDKFPVGREVTILYDALDSTKFLVKEFDVNVFGIVGIVFMVVGIILFVIGAVMATS